jgi:DNA-binding NarL/FixJ family response regulator
MAAVLSELRDVWSLLIAAVAGAIAVWIAPWPVAVAVVIAVLAVRVATGRAWPRATAAPTASTSVGPALGSAPVTPPRPLPTDVTLGPGGRLTATELRVADLVAQGLKNKEIAERFVVSDRTVDNHVQAILRKLDFHSRTQITRWWVEVYLPSRRP